MFMDFSYYILTPFALLLKILYNLFNSYGVALLFFALVVKLILFPFSLKGKKSMIQTSMLSGKMQKLQKMYGNNQQKYNEEVQKLYEREHVNPMSGCLWSLVPLFIILPLYAIIRQPMKYMMGMTPEQIVAAGNGVLNWAQASIDNGWVKNVTGAAQNLLTEKTVSLGYNQLYLSSLMTAENLEAVKAAVGETGREVFAINFKFLGVDLSQVPQLKFWVNGLMGFGLLMVPVISAVTSILFSMVSTRTNQMNSGKELNEQTQKTNRTMMLISPLMSLWIGFGMPAALSVYWVANNLLGMGQEVICSRLLKKDYERAAEEARRREQEEKEEEKRRRREKAEQRAREAEEARKNRGKKKAPKEAEEGKISAEVRQASRVGMRQYARGRAYDPNRYGGVTPYHEELAGKVLQEQAEQPAQPEGGSGAALYPGQAADAPEQGDAPAQEKKEIE